MFKFYLYIVLLLLALFLVFIARDLYRAWRSKSWSGVEGVVLESKLLSHGRSMMMGRNYERYSALIRYEYNVSGKFYKSDTVRFFAMGTSTSREAVQKLVSQYQVGDSVHVFFDPAQPSHSTLQKGFNFKSFFTLIAIVAFMGFILHMISTL